MVYQVLDELLTLGCELMTTKERAVSISQQTSEEHRVPLVMCSAIEILSLGEQQHMPDFFQKLKYLLLQFTGKIQGSKLDMVDVEEQQRRILSSFWSSYAQNWSLRK